MFLAVTGKPPGKFIVIDCGSEKAPIKEMQNIVHYVYGYVDRKERYNVEK